MSARSNRPCACRARLPGATLPLARIACAIVAAAAGCGEPESAERASTREPRAEISLSPSRVKIAEPFELRIAVEHADGLRAKFPPVGSGFDGLDVVNAGAVKTRHLEPGVSVSERVVRLRGFRAGAYTLGPYDILLVPEAGTVATVTVSKAQVEVVPVVVGASNLSDLRPSQGPFELRDEPGGARAAVTVAVLVVAAAVAAAVVLRATSRRRQAARSERARRPADEVALERLRAVRESGILEEGRVSEYTDQVSDVLRSYLEERFALPAPDRTTEEFLDVIAREPVLDRERKKFLAEYLAQCDLVKFAAQDPGRRELDELYAASVRFVQETAAGGPVSAGAES